MLCITSCNVEALSESIETASFKGFVSLHMPSSTTDNGPLTTDALPGFSGKASSSTNNRKGLLMFHPLFPGSHLPITRLPISSCSSVPPNRSREITRVFIWADRHSLKTPFFVNQ
jgi:hypothetical protein